MEIATTDPRGSTSAGTVLDRWTGWLASGPVLWALVTLGAALRIANYAANRSLWADEASLAYNIIGRSFGELARPLDLAQVAPLGFLWLERGAVVLFGPSEYALRLVPLLASLAALALAVPLARRTLEGLAVPFAVALFAISNPLLYYSGETKQYALDVAATMGLALLTLVAREDDPRRPRRLLALGIAGALAPWFSQPSVFVLGGAGLYLLAPVLRTRRWRGLRPLALPVALWALGATAATIHSFHAIPPLTRSRLDFFWAPAFLPLRDGLFATVRWLSHALVAEMAWLFSPSVTMLALALVVLGAAALARRRDGSAMLVLAPVVLGLLASALRLYPFATRLTLVFAPLFIVIVSAAAGWLLALAGRRVLFQGLAMSLMGALGAAGVLDLRALPFAREELRPVLEYVAAHRRPGDVIYVYYGASRAMRYYAPRVGLQDSSYELAPCLSGDWHDYLTALDARRGTRRFWLVLSHPFNKGGVREDSLFTGYLEHIGRRIDGIERPGALAELYDLSDTTRARTGSEHFALPTSHDSSAAYQRCFSWSVEHPPLPTPGS
ncbi:MAG: glycosyltransferase family 39 protein, partial [Gemmatimonadaceae bacterium]|nr:glycosyltransferase family 39 protein [Gemmatimonadaceae bacterium]